MLSEKQILKEILQERFEAFLYGSDSSYLAPSSSLLPSKLLSQTLSSYSKNSQKVGNGAVDFINEADQTQFFIWRTHPTNIEKAVRYGLIKFDSLTSKILYSLGKYHRSVHNRAYQQGVISNKHELKMALLTLCQNNIKALEPLERLLNQYDPTIPPSENKKKLIKAINNYLKQIESNYKNIEINQDNFEKYDKDIYIKWRQQHTHLQSQCLKIKNTLFSQTQPAQIKEHFQKEGINSLYLFIKQLSIINIRNTQEINQNISFSNVSFSLRRGDLNSVCEDALKEINDDEIDYYNPVYKAHQGKYNQKNQQVAISFENTGQNIKELNEILMGICQVETQDKISKDSENNYQLNGNYLTTTPYTQWKSQKETSFLKRTGIMIWNIFAGIFVGLTIDLILGLIYGIMGKKLEALSPKTQIETKNPLSEKNHYHHIRENFILKKYSLINIIFYQLSTKIYNAYQDFKKSSNIKKRKSTLPLWPELYTDFNEERNILTANQLEKIYQSINQLEATHLAVKSDIDNHLPIQESIETNKTLNIKQPFSLSNGEWLDISNAMLSSMVMGSDIFSHEIYNKNPFLGLIFCSAYAMASLSVLHPVNVSFLPVNYIKFCNALSSALAKNKSAGAFSGASMQAQSSVAFLENILNGNASWIANAKKYIENDPATIVLSASLATSLGALIAYKLNIPMVSQNLKNELGTIPYPSLAVAGGKGVFLLMNLLQEKNEPILYSSKTSIRNDNENRHKKINIDKLSFLMLLESKSYFLPHLSPVEKRNLLNHSKYLFNDNQLNRTVHSLLYPPTHQSVFMVTLKTMTNYVPLIIRCFLSPFSGSDVPQDELNFKIRKDLARVYNATSKGLYGITNFIKVFTKCFFDLIANESLARTEGYLSTNNHSVSQSSYAILSILDTNITQIRTSVSQGLNIQKKKCSHAAPFVLFDNKIQLSTLSFEEENAKIKSNHSM